MEIRGKKWEDKHGIEEKEGKKKQRLPIFGGKVQTTVTTQPFAFAFLLNTSHFYKHELV